MSLLQTTSKRGLTHYFSVYGYDNIKTPHKKSYYYCQCGTAVKVSRFSTATQPPKGKVCPKCKAKIDELAAYYNRVSEVVGGE